MKCPECKGSGQWRNTPFDCDVCDGLGLVLDSDDLREEGEIDDTTKGSV